MVMPDRTQLSPTAADALATLQEPIGRADGHTRDEAAALLVDDGFNAVDAGALLDELLSKGYLYEVDEQLYVTPS